MCKWQGRLLADLEGIFGMVWQSTESRKDTEFTLVGQREDTLNIQASSRA